MKLQVVSAVLFSALAQTSGSGFTDASLDILVGDYACVTRQFTKYALQTSTFCSPLPRLALLVSYRPLAPSRATSPQAQRCAEASRDVSPRVGHQGSSKTISQACKAAAKRRKTSQNCIIPAQPREQSKNRST